MYQFEIQKSAITESNKKANSNEPKWTHLIQICRNFMENSHEMVKSVQIFELRKAQMICKCVYFVWFEMQNQNSMKNETDHNIFCYSNSNMKMKRTENGWICWQTHIFKFIQLMIILHAFQWCVCVCTSIFHPHTHSPIWVPSSNFTWLYSNLLNLQIFATHILQAYLTRVLFYSLYIVETPSQFLVLLSQNSYIIKICLLKKMKWENMHKFYVWNAHTFIKIYFCFDCEMVISTDILFFCLFFVCLLKGCLYLCTYNKHFCWFFWRTHFVLNFTRFDRWKCCCVCVQQIPLSVSPVWLQLMSPILQAPLNRFLFFHWIISKIFLSHTFEPFIYSTVHIQKHTIFVSAANVLLFCFLLIVSTTLLSFCKLSSYRSCQKHSKYE